MRTFTQFAALAALVWLGTGGAEGATLAQGVQLFTAGKLGAARKVFEPAAGTNAQAAYYMGRIELASRQTDKAIERLEKAVELAPKNAEYLVWLGRAYGQAAMSSNILRQASLAGKTREAWEKAVSLDPANLDARESLLQLYLLAPAFMGGGHDKAEAQAAEIAKRDAVRGHLAAATLASHKKDDATAERELAAAVSLAPADARARIAQGFFYQRRERWNESFEALEAGLEANPKATDLLFFIGRAAALSGQRLNRAEECLKAYLSKPPGPESPSHAAAHFRLGMVYEKKGDKPRAKAQYQQAVKLDPSNKEAKEALAKLG
jgi:tetratricopeptide (TPR) repeat protein